MNAIPPPQLPAPFKVLELPSIIESLEPLHHQLRLEEWALRRDCIIAARNGLQRYLDGTFTRMTIAEIARFIELASALGRNVVNSAADSAQSAKDPLRTAMYEKQLDEIFGQPIEVPSQKPENANEPPLCDLRGNEGAELV